LVLSSTRNLLSGFPRLPRVEFEGIRQAARALIDANAGIAVVVPAQDIHDLLVSEDVIGAERWRGLRK
jgi:hypothetical protein